MKLCFAVVLGLAILTPFALLHGKTSPQDIPPGAAPAAQKGDDQQNDDGQKSQKDDGPQNHKDDSQQNQKDDGGQNQKDDGQHSQSARKDAEPVGNRITETAAWLGKQKLTENIPLVIAAQPSNTSDLKPGTSVNQTLSKDKVLGARLKEVAADRRKDSSDQSNKGDSQQNQKDDGQQNQKDDGQQNQKDDGQQNQKDNGQ